MSAVTVLAETDKSALPKKVTAGLNDASDTALSVFDKLTLVQSAQAALAEAEVSYAAPHAEVRALQRDMRKIDAQVKRYKRELLAAEAESDKNHIQQEIDDALARKETLAARIPAEWEGIEEAYQSKLKDLSKAQRNYRRAMDDSYSKVDEVIISIGALSELETYAPQLSALLASLDSLNKDDKQAAIKAEESALGKITGGSAVKSLLSKARRAIKKDDDEKAAGLLSDAAAQMEAELAWRRTAQTDILPVLVQYQQDTADTIGLRGQSRLPEFLVPRISACRSEHRDISLKF